MGVTKTEFYSTQQIEIARLAKVLGHPARIAIVQHVIQSQSCICGDLVEEIGLAQATISQHLRELKQAHILKGTVEGTSVCYCLNTDTWSKVADLFSTLFAASSADQRCC